MKKICVLLLLLISINTLAQGEAANWFFGFGAGMEFNQALGTINVVDTGQLSTNEGCATISDATGNLLFYTDGSTIWNRAHAVMTNGTGLFGDASSTQSAIIVPKPNDPDIYYVFTVDNLLDGFDFGLNYSVVDISLSGGLGAVTVKNTNLLARCSEKITAVLKDCLTKSIWVLTFASPDGSPGPFNTFHAFEVSDLGINASSIKSTFGTNIFDQRGYLKLSPDGTKLASANMSGGLFLYDFDVSPGIISNEQPLSISSINIASYGVEFSPSSEFLYVHSSNDFFGPDPTTHSSSLTQFNVMAADIQSTEFELDNRFLYRGGLQLGPDGKIYRALSATYNQGLPYLGVINNPNNVGASSNYQHNAISLAPNNSSQGLPPFIQSLFDTQIDIIRNGESTMNLALCDGESYTLIADDIPGATYTWTMDGNLLPESDFDLIVTQSGHYVIYIDPNNGDCAIEGQAFVNYNPNPQAFNDVLIQCDEDGMVDGLTQFNLNEANMVLTGGLPGLSTRFFLSLADAQADTNNINGSAFGNTVNPQIIYVRVFNDITGCFNVSELTLDVSLTDSSDTQLFVCDDDGIEDGFASFNLSDANNAIVNGLPLGLVISYFETYNDALLEQNDLGLTFTNTIPYNQTIYARVENANDCYGISQVFLTVHELPDIVTDDIVFYCLNFFPQTISLNAAIINDSPANYTYSWSTGESTFEIQINQIGTYDVTVTNANGCSKVRSINVQPSNIATFESIEVVDATQNNTVTVIVSGEGEYVYALYNDDGVYVDFQTSNTFNNVFPGIYTVHVKDIKNDCGTIQDLVSVIGFPKYFTPNNDGYHDTWHVYGVSGMFQPDSKIYIFDRYGKLLKQLNPSGNGWDGTLNGDPLPTSDYWFAVTLQDGRVFKNHFTLKR